MSDESDFTSRGETPAAVPDGDGGNPVARPQADRKQGDGGSRRFERGSGPRLKKLRLALVAAGLVLLGVVSWVFGVMMAVAGDLPDLEARAQFDRAENSVVLDRNGRKLATLTGNERRILVESEDIALPMKQAVVAIEDERFYEHRGIDYLGLARALREDIVTRSASQGGSTITQQFVKNALEAQDSRTILQKLKEGALAYQIERQWSKDKILTNYLNNIYFGEGAYGIEAAARTYFGANHPGCGVAGGTPCVFQLQVEEAAMLAGMISSPAAYSPKANPADSVERRNLVLDKMREQGTLEVSDAELEQLKATEPPETDEIEPPAEPSDAPYFTDWLRQQVVDKYGAGKAFGGGLEVTSTLDKDLQNAAEQVVTDRLSGLGPTGAVVAIDNGTGEVRAMVGGTDFEKSPFNLATNGRRQPGSSFKPFTLLTALSNGKTPTDVYESKPVEIPFTNTIRKNGEKKKVEELFEVNNYEDSYLGSATIADATTFSDNSVYAQLGTEVGTDKIAATAEKMGIASNVPENPAMILGGLKRGVTPLDMAYAYNTLANGGELVSGTMASRGNGKGPVAIRKVEAKGEKVSDDLGAGGENDKVGEQVIDPGVADQATEILHTVVTDGTGTNAQVGDDYIWGKTGTTDNNADAWFVGANEQITVAVWVGYEDGATPMETEYGGAPVDGGTIPALIWSDVVEAFDEIATDSGEIKPDEGTDPEATTEATDPAAPAPAPVPETAPAPEPAPEPAPAPDPAAPPEPAPETPAAPPPSGEAAPGGGTEGGAAPG